MLRNLLKKVENGVIEARLKVHKAFKRKKSPLVDVVAVSSIETNQHEKPVVPGLDLETVRRLAAEKEEKLRQSEENYQLRKNVHRPAQVLIDPLRVRDKQHKTHASQMAAIKRQPTSNLVEILVEGLKVAGLIALFLLSCVAMTVPFFMMVNIYAVASVIGFLGACVTIAGALVLSSMGAALACIALDERLSRAPKQQNHQNHHRSDQQVQSPSSTANVLRQRKELDRGLTEPTSSVKYVDKKTNTVRMFSSVAAKHRASALQLARKNVVR